jgi:hypothetical protein
MKKEVVISSSSLNSYGFRVLTEGIDTRQFVRNPLLLWNHSRDILPIGRVENLRTEADKLIGTVLFDDSDDFARQIKAKFEKGFLRMISAGLEVLETSREFLLPGQRRATVVKSKLIEVSITDIGANDDALALWRDNKLALLNSGNQSGDAWSVVPEIVFKDKLKDDKMKLIALKLGLPETASEGEILERIGALQEHETLVANLRAEVEAHRINTIESEVDAAIAQKKIMTDKREHFVTLGKASGVELLRATLSVIEPAVKPLDLINQSGGGVPKTYKNFGEIPEKERIELRKNKPDEYLALFEAEYGFVPQII